MTYFLENLNPERFQLLCQAIVVAENSLVQCLPVGMPDGGRDAFSITKRSSPGFIVYQVKFVRNPGKISDVFNYVKGIIEGELDKVAALLKRGASGYILFINLQGTSHLDSGTIDRVNEYVAATLPIDAKIYWRDDIERRLDVHSSIRWSFPEILSGASILDILIQRNFTESNRKAINILKLFLEAQYIEDEEVKFKQVDLKNSLIDLFIDVPIRSESPKFRRAFFEYELFESNDIGAVEFFCQGGALTDHNSVVLEGAPGQGKSTLAQFICQINRAFLLSKDDIIDKLPEALRPSELKTPIKIDLRDFATWLSGRNPFDYDDEKDNYRSHNSAKSLDSFICSLINHKSGGTDLTMEDLHKIVSETSLLIFLDGFDEVPEISRRTEIIETVTRDVKKLRSLNKSISVFVTSRPSAFINAPGFPKKDYHHFSLLSLGKDRVLEYTEKWLKTKDIKPAQASEIRLILKNKLSQPHMAELTRNTMQLAILLNLIHTKGNALPDKITALYDGYVNLFFDRESEKNNLVRDYRDILIDLHRYLAWHLHCLAEVGVSDGSMSRDEILSVLREYLINEGRDNSIASSLFNGMIERVVFLVSRTEGRYEFEVQPLREYFAARHIYETAPSSSIGSEQNDSKPDRFDVLIRNPYWLNVARFYAGCYSKGELPSIIDCIERMTEDDNYRLTSMPQKITATLLSDWVFFQNAKCTQQAIRIVLSALGRQHMLADYNSYGSYEDAVKLPDGCGRQELLNESVKILDNENHYDYVFEIANILRANSNNSNLYTLVKDRILASQSSESVIKWLYISSILGIIHQFENHVVNYCLEKTKFSEEAIHVLYSGGSSSNLLANPTSQRIIINMITSGDLRVNTLKQMDEVRLFAWLINPFNYSIIFNRGKIPAPLSHTLLAYGRSNAEDIHKIESKVRDFAEYDPTRRTILDILPLHEVSLSTWHTSLEPWNNVSETIRGNFGDIWPAYEISFLASNIVSSEDRGSAPNGIFDSSEPLCNRTRYMRFRRGQPSWWLSSYHFVKNETDLIYFFSALMAWGSKRTILACSNLINAACHDISDAAFEKIFSAFNFARGEAVNRFQDSDVVEFLDSIEDDRMLSLICQRSTETGKLLILKNRLLNYNGYQRNITSMVFNLLYMGIARKSISWPEALKISARFYHGELSPRHRQRLFFRIRGNLDHEGRVMPSLEAARSILREPEKYPRQFIALADKIVNEHIGSLIKPMRTESEQRGWKLHS